LIWNVDSLDWKTKNVAKNIENVKQDTKEGSIILMHDIHKTTVDSVDEIIKILKSEGFEFVTVSELLAHYQTSDYSHKVCYSGFNCK
jgi:peptidoglycan/xylan/chitin deacetylase (PgdA/CDA1 family)